MTRARAALCLALLVGCEPSARPVRLDVRPFESLSCRPDVLRVLEIRPRGDAPSGTLLTRSVELSDRAELSLEPFPPATELVAITALGEQAGGAPWSGGAVALLGPTGEGDFELSLLELGEPCLFNDAPASADADGFALGLPGGVVLAGGGSLDGRARRDVALYRAFDDRADAGALRLAVSRAGAAAVALRTEEPTVLVIGGGSPGSTEALDTADVLRPDAASAGELELTVVTARREHDARVLPDGRVLVVGGWDAIVDDRPRLLEEAELLTPVEGRLSFDRRALAAHPRQGPRALTLGGGRVVVVGGRDEEGPVGVVEELRGDRLERLTVVFPARDGAAWAASSAGVVQLGGREGEGWSDAMELWVGGAEVITVEGALTASRDTREAHPLREPLAAPLPDGRVLVTGRVPDRIGELRPVARVIDPGGSRDPSPSIPLNVQPRHLVPLPDGSVALVGEEATDFLRLDVATALDDPPANLLPVALGELDQLALDGPGRWGAQGDALVARTEGARFDVPRARFRAVDVELDVVGAVTLLLTRDEAPAIEVDITDDAIAHGTCLTSRRAGDTVVVRLEADALVLGGDARRSCPLELDTRVGVAIRAASGSGISRIGLRRL